jgi:N-glycosylase/DNA lyase
LTEQNYRDFGFGYRANYLEKFIKNYPEFLKNPMNREKTLELNKKLQEIEGIGQKVSDCIKLFAFGDLNLFPVDTWMKKFMLKYYIKGKKISNKRIRELGMTMFGKWAGYAQEFIYHYARSYDLLL